MCFPTRSSLAAWQFEAHGGPLVSFRKRTSALANPLVLNLQPLDFIIFKLPILILVVLFGAE